MKHLKTFLVAVVMIVGATGFVNAQSKVAHINTQTLISEMPAMKAAQVELEKLSKTYEADIQDRFTKYQNKAKQYGAEAESQTDATNAARQEELLKMEQEITKYRNDAAADLSKRRDDLLKPLMEQAKKAVEKVAKAQGFDYVIDSSNGGGVILADGKDLLADVKKELGF
ncbi:OmpH family outer membrane protein [Sungkyunkwania multivorans]|uniref:OmpH family outer membrane protein n=1 Tax=Sungkyunkwania multivorans TaxID=1173618 RepID=A0ABW3D118_9FLAO